MWKIKKCPLQDLEHGKKTENHRNEKHTLQEVKYGEEKYKRWDIQECPLQDLEYGEKTENHGK